MHKRNRCRRENLSERRRRGWHMNLYRNTREGKLGGVCAGLADHWDIAPWVMRLAWIGALIFTGALAFWAYVGAWVLLAPRPSGTAGDVEMEYDERRHDYRPRRVFSYPEDSGTRLKRARDRLDTALRRVEAMEGYVTSRRYELDREFSRL